MSIFISIKSSLLTESTARKEKSGFILFINLLFEIFIESNKQTYMVNFLHFNRLSQFIWTSKSTNSS